MNPKQARKVTVKYPGFDKAFDVNEHSLWEPDARKEKLQESQLYYTFYPVKWTWVLTEFTAKRWLK